MSKKDVQLNIRISQDLKDRIEKSAKNNNRSINAEAITLIEKSLYKQEYAEKHMIGDSSLIEKIREKHPESSKDIDEQDLVLSFNIVADEFIKINEDKIKEMSINALSSVLSKRESKKK
ncbi:Arc family DNA-binding protein [Providencia rettgeri]|uniref:Arc family DNA-binding protein n=1 Tax=Proteus mirabilis TaxID=584 RepID=UPI0007C176A3|nr:Arc family DNA-binding protein [Proteus mirabilis]AND13478.1 hypothetical protein AOUC001_11485 [Proteus mirabilis]EJD6083309.1 Arc family DNA-binding protein [Providencia rettgeri]EJD6598891.1 Arc family DNA-binding protein [Providencia rettgeri]